MGVEDGISSSEEMSRDQKKEFEEMMYDEIGYTLEKLASYRQKEMYHCTVEQLKLVRSKISELRELLKG